jgi:hypothetical protein
MADAVLFLNRAVPILDYTRSTVSPSRHEMREMVLLHNVNVCSAVSGSGEEHLITGTVPVYRFICGRDDPLAPVVYLEGEADEMKYAESEIKTEKSFFGKKTCKYVESGLVRLRKDEFFKIVLKGPLVIIKH